MAYQALPPAFGLIERAKLDADIGEVIQFVPRLFREGLKRGSRPWPVADALCQELRKLAAQHPGLESRNCFLDSRWDALHYLLSANRREEPATERDIALDHALRGATEIADHVRGGQGEPVRYVAPDEVASIARLLEPMSLEELRCHYDPQKMKTAGVYKFWADRADEVWLSIVRHFKNFRRFYLEAARHEEGIIACLD